MTWIKNIVMTFLWTLTRGETNVSCVFMESCILPCTFRGGINAVIYWTLMKARNTSVHSYYYNQDQLIQQDQRFRGRTSLFKDQISKGNASLQLMWVEVQDEGRYKCHTMGNSDSFISLKVEAPVHEVNIHELGSRITCSSEGIYPEPVLTWSTSRPSILKSTTIVQQTEQQLYNINSSLIPPDTQYGFTDLTYSCTVSTRSNNNTAILSNCNQKEGIAKGVVVGVVMVAVILGLIPVCYNKFNNKSHQAQQVPDPTEKSSQLDYLSAEKENSYEMKTFNTHGDDQEGDNCSEKAAAEPTEM